MNQLSFLINLSIHHKVCRIFLVLVNRIIQEIRWIKYILTRLDVLKLTKYVHFTFIAEETIFQYIFHVLYTRSCIVSESFLRENAIGFHFSSFIAEAIRKIQKVILMNYCLHISLKKFKKTNIYSHSSRAFRAICALWTE